MQALTLCSCVCACVCACTCCCVSICRPCYAEGTATWLRPRYLRCPSCCQSHCCRNRPRVLVRRRCTRLPRAGVAHPDRSSAGAVGSLPSCPAQFVAPQLPALLRPFHPPALNRDAHSQILGLYLQTSPALGSAFKRSEEKKKKGEGGAGIPIIRQQG